MTSTESQSPPSHSPFLSHTLSASSSSSSSSSPSPSPSPRDIFPVPHFYPSDLPLPLSLVSPSPLSPSLSFPLPSSLPPFLTYDYLVDLFDRNPNHSKKDEKVKESEKKRDRERERERERDKEREKLKDKVKKSKSHKSSASSFSSHSKRMGDNSNSYSHETNHTVPVDIVANQMDFPKNKKSKSFHSNGNSEETQNKNANLNLLSISLVSSMPSSSASLPPTPTTSPVPSTPIVYRSSLKELVTLPPLPSISPPPHSILSLSSAKQLSSYLKWWRSTLPSISSSRSARLGPVEKKFFPGAGLRSSKNPNPISNEQAKLILQGKRREQRERVKAKRMEQKEKAASALNHHSHTNGNALSSSSSPSSKASAGRPRSKGRPPMSKNKPKPSSSSPSPSRRPRQSSTSSSPSLLDGDEDEETLDKLVHRSQLSNQKKRRRFHRSSTSPSLSTPIIHFDPIEDQLLPHWNSSPPFPSFSTDFVGFSPSTIGGILRTWDFFALFRVTEEFKKINNEGGALGGMERATEGQNPFSLSELLMSLAAKPEPNLIQSNANSLIPFNYQYALTQSQMFYSPSSTFNSSSTLPSSPSHHYSLSLIFTSLLSCAYKSLYSNLQLSKKTMAKRRKNGLDEKSERIFSSIVVNVYTWEDQLRRFLFMCEEFNKIFECRYIASFLLFNPFSSLPVHQKLFVFLLLSDYVINSQWIREIIDKNWEENTEMRKKTRAEKILEGQSMKILEKSMTEVSRCMANIMEKTEDELEGDIGKKENQKRDVDHYKQMEQDAIKEKKKQKVVQKYASDTLRVMRQKSEMSKKSLEEREISFISLRPTRRECLGTDRHHNRYWKLGDDDSLLFVEFVNYSKEGDMTVLYGEEKEISMKEERERERESVEKKKTRSDLNSPTSHSEVTWAYFHNQKQMDSLLSFLNSKGMRENALKKRIQENTFTFPSDIHHVKKENIDNENDIQMKKEEEKNKQHGHSLSFRSSSHSLSSPPSWISLFDSTKHLLRAYVILNADSSTPPILRCPTCQESFNEEDERHCPFCHVNFALNRMSQETFSVHMATCEEDCKVNEQTVEESEEEGEIFPLSLQNELKEQKDKDEMSYLFDTQRNTLYTNTFVSKDEISVPLTLPKIKMKVRRGRKSQNPTDNDNDNLKEEDDGEEEEEEEEDIMEEIDDGENEENDPNINGGEGERERDAEGDGEGEGEHGDRRRRRRDASPSPSPDGNANAVNMEIDMNLEAQLTSSSSSSSSSSSTINIKKNDRSSSPSPSPPSSKPSRSVSIFRIPPSSHSLLTVSPTLKVLKSLLLEVEAAIPVEAVPPKYDKLRNKWINRVKMSYSVPSLSRRLLDLHSNLRKDYLRYWMDSAAWTRQCKQFNKTESQLAANLFTFDKALIYSEKELVDEMKIVAEREERMAKLSENVKGAEMEEEEWDGDGCRICHSTEKPTKLLICDCCQLENHLYCLDPPLKTVPKGSWYCQKCEQSGAVQKMLKNQQKKKGAGGNNRRGKIDLDDDEEEEDEEDDDDDDEMDDGYGVCCECKQNEGDPLLCDNCNNAYHLHCCNPPLLSVPDGNWYCVDCIQDNRAKVEAKFKKMGRVARESYLRKDEDVLRMLGDDALNEEFSLISHENKGKVKGLKIKDILQNWNGNGKPQTKGKGQAANGGKPVDKKGKTPSPSSSSSTRQKRKVQLEEEDEEEKEEEEEYVPENKDSATEDEDEEEDDDEDEEDGDGEEGVDDIEGEGEEEDDDENDHEGEEVEEVGDALDVTEDVDMDHDENENDDGEAEMSFENNNQNDNEDDNDTGNGDNTEDESDVCTVCFSDDSPFSSSSSSPSSPMQCDGCQESFHPECYGLSTIPKGRFLCERCTFSLSTKECFCFICNQREGAMKIIQQDDSRNEWNGKWCHVFCVLWNENLHFGDEKKMENILGINTIDVKSLHKSQCDICKVRKGITHQCGYETCRVRFHAYCAITHSSDGYSVRKDSKGKKIFRCRNHT